MNIRPAFLALLVLGIVTLLGAGSTFVRAQDAAETPTSGWDLHIDAMFHFSGDAQAIAHHWCKGVAGGLTECQLYDSDAPDARLAGVEVIVDAATWQGLSAEEQALWHYHREEIPLIAPTLPDLTEEEAAQVAESIMETYGKVYLLLDPTTEGPPTGQPFVHDVSAAVADATPSPAP